LLPVQADPPLNSIDDIESSVETQRRKTMDRIRLLAIGTMLIFALTTVAQQATAGGPAKGLSGDVSGGGGVPTVEEQMS
jgi:hypothetical protein